MPDKRRYCLLSPGRAGSKVLCDALNSTQTVSAVFEIFHPGLKGDPGNFYGFLLEKNDPEVFLPDRRDTMFLSYCAQREAKFPVKNAFIYDVKYFHVHHLNGVSHSHTATPHLFDLLKTNFTGIIHLKRLCGIRMCISMYVANARNKWHSKEIEEIKTVAVDLPLLLGELRNFSREEASFRNHIGMTELPLLELFYEELFDPADNAFDEKTLQKLTAFIDIKDEISRIPPLKRTMSQPLSSVVENYDELAAAVRDWISRGLVDQRIVLGSSKSLEEC